jgi:hypothetical protein
MPDDDGAAYRRHYRATGDDIRVRESEELDDDEGVFEIRMPIASTGDVRNDGDDPLSRNELNGMARQLSDRQIGVFPAHGADDMIAMGRYSPFERLGDWEDSAIESREDENVLMATARMPDPETLPAATGDYREALAILKEQAKRGVAQDASIGWRDDEDFPGGVDLMEASIVGIGADWRTNTGDESAEVVARAAIEAGADPEELAETVRAVAADADTQDHDSMTDDNPDDEPTDEQNADGDDADTQDGDTEQVRQSPAEIADMAEDYVMGAVEGAIDDLREELEDMMGDGENEGEKPDDEDEDDEDDDGEQSADTPDEEQDAEPDGERDTDDDAEELRSELDTLRDELDDLRENGVTADDVDTPDTDGEQNAEDGDESDGEDTRDAEAGFEDLGDYRH